MKRIVITLCLSIFLITAVFTNLVNAQQATFSTWTGGTGDWGTGANWDDGEPDSWTHASINNGGTAQISQNGEAANFFDLANKLFKP